MDKNVKEPLMEISQVYKNLGMSMVWLMEVTFLRGHCLTSIQQHNSVVTEMFVLSLTDANMNDHLEMINIYWTFLIINNRGIGPLPHQA